MFDDKTLLQMAEQITSENRNDDYGHPLIDFTRQALLQTILKMRIVTPLEIVHDQYICKVSRLATSPTHADSHLDLAGYAQTMDMCDRKMKDLGYGNGMNNFLGWEDWRAYVSFAASILEDTIDSVNKESYEKFQEKYYEQYLRVGL